MSETELSPVALRVKEFIDYLQISNSQFADQSGIPRPTLSQLLHGRNKTINDLLLQKLHNAYPQLNLLWLLFGKGEMVEIVNSPTTEPTQRDTNTVNLDNETPKNLVNDQSIAYMVTPLDESPAPSAASADTTQESRSVRSLKTKAETSSRRVKSIIVLYTDNSFQTFHPEES